MRRALARAVGAAARAGCGGTAAERGHATLWVTRDRGTQVLLVRTVPAGLTAIQALDRVADIETTYGGRYVQSISGIDGSIFSRHDWFYFVNGIEGDRSAAEVRLRPGDIEWWDYRSWATQMRQPVVVGAFPEPFAHGTTVVQGAPHGLAVRLARRLGGPGRARNIIRLVPGGEFRAELHGNGVSATLGVETARRLLRDPSAVRYRYEVP